MRDIRKWLTGISISLAVLAITSIGKYYIGDILDVEELKGYKGWGKVAVAALLSGSLYKIIIITIIRALSIDFILKKKLKSDYLKGTWCGVITNPEGKKYLFYEKYEQDIESLRISGWSYEEDNLKNHYARWVSEAVIFDRNTNELKCIFKTSLNKPDRDERIGVGVFHVIDRNGEHPQSMSGYAYDVSPRRHYDYGTFNKISKKYLSESEAKIHLQALLTGEPKE